MLKILFVFSLYVLSSGKATKRESEANILDIGGIFPISGKGGWQGGQVNGEIFDYKRFRLGLPNYQQKTSSSGNRST